MKFINYLNNKLNITINDQALVLQALRHTSYVNEGRKPAYTSNERLEFLGDAVLELAVSDYLYHQYPQESEGFLTRLRAQLVREESLAYIARQNKLNRYIRLGKGEAANHGHERDSILADALEALLGALYLDQGMGVAVSFLTQELLDHHQDITRKLHQDYKTMYQELVQQQGSVMIEYRLLNQSGPAHNQTFEMGLYVNGVFQSQGRGKSKKNAEMEAAKRAYEAARGKE